MARAHTGIPRWVNLGVLFTVVIGSGVVFFLHAGIIGGKTRARPAVDLGIGDISGLGQPGLSALGSFASRPGVLVAWRNTQKILEVETLVTNHGTRAAKGRLVVTVLNEDHRVLATQPSPSRPFVVRVPSYDRGGDQGITVQVPGTYNLNHLLDGIDRAHDPYCIRISVAAVGVQDGNPLNNTAVKCYNVSTRIRAGGVGVSQYVLRNSTRAPIRGSLLIERSPLPRGWSLDASPRAGTTVELASGASLLGTVTVHAPAIVHEGEYIDVRPILVDEHESVIDGSEFYAAADSRSPLITHAYVAPGRDPHSVYLVLRAIDRGSGVAEASGASVEWSTDTGFTMNERTLTYQDGNFLSPTGFDTDLGPFAVGTHVRLALTVRDVVGNGTSTASVTFVIPLRRPIDFK